MRIRDIVDSDSVWPLIYGLAVLLLFGLFVFSLRGVLSPLVLFLALVLMLTPYAGTRRFTLALIAIVFLMLIWMLRTTGFLLAPFILAFVLAYILDPAVDGIQRLGLPRGAGVALLALPAIALVLVGLLFGIPALADQVQDLIDQAPVLVARAGEWLEGVRRGLSGIDLPFVREDELLAWLRPPDAQEVIAFVENRWANIADRAWSAVLGLGEGIGTVLTILGYIVLTPVLTYYLLRDYDRFTARAAVLIPETRRESWTDFLREYNLLLSRYLRGQVLVALIVGTLIGVGLWLLRFPYSGLVGAVAGVFNLVPYLGPIVGLIPALVIAFLSGSVLISLLKVAAVFITVQIVDSSVLGPRIVGGSVGLHPVWVMLALALGGFYFGFVGLLLAVPVAALLRLLARRGVQLYEHSGLYKGETAQHVTDPAG